MDEGGDRLQFIPSSTPNFSSFLASLSACLSFIFWLPNSLFLISRCLSCSICVTPCPSVSFLFFILFLSACLSHFKFKFTLLTPPTPHPQSPFSLPQPLSPPCSFTVNVKHLRQMKKKHLSGHFLCISVIFHSLLPSFTCKNNCNNNLSNSIIKIFLSVPALSLPLSLLFSHPPSPPSPPSLIITIQSHQITNHVFYVKP